MSIDFAIGDEGRLVLFYGCNDRRDSYDNEDLAVGTAALDVTRNGVRS